MSRRSISLRSIVLFICCLTTGFIGSIHAQTDIGKAAIEFKNQDQLVRSLQPEEFSSFAEQKLLNVFEVHEQRERQYKAYPVQLIFDQIFGPRWRAADEIIFACKDGYQPSIPVAKFLVHTAYLAVASADDSPFVLNNILQNHEKVALGPAYLIWDNLGFPALLDEGAVDMPYQIVGIELASFAARFPKMFPAADAPAEIRRGFLNFRKYCMACHAINGQGGGKAPELNYPVSVTEYFKPEYLKRWIHDPASMRYNTTIPALSVEIPERAQVIDEIIAYLTAMSTLKNKLPEQDTQNKQPKN